MEWIKRNLLFVVGSAVALVLMTLAAFYLISGSKKNEAALGQLNEEYAILERLNNQNPHPGDDEVNNIEAAKQQKAEVDLLIKELSTVFKPVRPIPNSTNLNNAMFAGSLRKVIDQLQAEAGKRGVLVPTNFYFSFTAVRDRIRFEQASLQPLAAQLGEVKAICDVLMDARVNALDAVRREKVCMEDVEAQLAADYLADTSVTNEIAILSPYEVTFRCFSSELAEVLSGYAGSPHGLIVRAMNVEPVTEAGAGLGAFGGGSPYYTPPQPVVPYMPPRPVVPGGRTFGEEEPAGGNPYLRQPPAGAATSPYATPNPYGTPTYGAAPRVSRGGLPTLLDEKQFKVTMLVQVVKLTLTN